MRLLAITTTAILLTACAGESPTAQKINAYCDSGAAVPADAIARQAVGTLNTYFRARGARFTLTGLDIVCDDETTG